MSDIKEHTHLGVYGLLIENDKILLVKKNGGPYHGKLDLPGGSLKHSEKPIDTLIREFIEETGIKINKYELFDFDSVSFTYKKEDMLIKEHHIGAFYKIIDYSNNIKQNIPIDNQNDDSMGAEFYDINKLLELNLSAIVILELKKLGYNLNRETIWK